MESTKKKSKSGFKRPESKVKVTVMMQCSSFPRYITIFPTVHPGSWHDPITHSLQQLQERVISAMDVCACQYVCVHTTYMNERTPQARCTHFFPIVCS